MAFPCQLVLLGENQSTMTNRIDWKLLMILFGTAAFAFSSCGKDNPSPNDDDDIFNPDTTTNTTEFTFYGQEEQTTASGYQYIPGDCQISDSDLDNPEFPIASIQVPESWEPTGRSVGGGGALEMGSITFRAPQGGNDLSIEIEPDDFAEKTDLGPEDMLWISIGGDTSWYEEVAQVDFHGQMVPVYHLEDRGYKAFFKIVEMDNYYFDNSDFTGTRYLYLRVAGDTNELEQETALSLFENIYINPCYEELLRETWE